jgi:hypothetical protein
MLGFAAIAAIGGAVSTALTTGFSIGDMRKMRKLQKESDADALKFRQEADKFLEVNVYDQLGVQMKPYEIEREALASVGAQSIEAARESERGMGSIGRIYAGYSDAIRDIQTRQGQEMADLEKLSAAEDSRLKDIKTQLALDEAEGAQTASAMYEERAQQAKKNAIAGGISMLGQAAKLAPLYGTDIKSEQAAFAGLELTPDQIQKIGNINFEGLGTAGQPVSLPQYGPLNAAESAILPLAASNFETKGGGAFTNLDLDAISQLSKPEYKAFVKSLTKDQYQMLFGNKQFGQLYNQAASANQFNPFQF